VASLLLFTEQTSERGRNCFREEGLPDALGKAAPVRKGHLRGPQPPPARGTLAQTAALRQELLLQNEYLAAENRIPIRINIRAEAAPPFWSTAR